MFERLSEKLESVFKKLRGHGSLSPELIKATLREIRLALLEADVNYKVTKELERRVEERASGADVAASLTPAQQVIKIVREELTEILGGTWTPIQYAPPPAVTPIMLVGLQGSGKTTSAAKLALRLTKEGRRPLITEENCLTCHHERGYLLGKPWGGISVSVPMKELRAIEWKSIRTVIFAHLLLWFLGIGGVTIGSRSLLASERGLRLAEEQARAAAARLQESNRLKDLFIDIVRHDLLNPASVVRYYTSFLQESETDPVKLDCYHKIESVNNRLMELIRNASKYSRLEEMDHVDCQVLDLNTLLLDALAVHELRLKEASIAVNYLPRNEYPITANPMVEDVFANIIANAIKYAASGKKLEIDILDQGTCWVVQIRDFGKGIPDKDKPLIFTRFTRLKKEGVEGSGLGLAIVKRLVDLHKGSIWVEDNPVGGSVFCVRLPKGGPLDSACANESA